MTKHYIILGFSCIILFTLLQFLSFSSIQAKIPTNNHETTIYVTHAPIKIIGNANFKEENGVIGGKGTNLDPWILESFQISIEADNCGIWIENTSDYFIIRNCIISPSELIQEETGIFIKNASNGVISKNQIQGNDIIGVSVLLSQKIIITSNILSNCYKGILVKDSDFITVLSNELTSCTLFGIYSFRSYFCNFTKNNCDNLVNGNSIVLENSSYNYVFENNCSNSELYSGIMLRYISNSYINGNNCSKNNIAGIITNFTATTSIQENQVQENQDGIWIESSNNIQIFNNNCINNTNSGILLFKSTNLILSQNECHENDIGISFCLSNENEIYENICNYNNIGVRFENASQNYITNNNFNWNSQAIFQDKLSSNNKFQGNSEKTVISTILLYSIAIVTTGILGFILYSRLKQKKISETPQGYSNHA